MAASAILAAAPTNATIHIAWVMIWFVMVGTAVAILVGLVLTRWGRSQPLRICVILSLIAHLLLAGYAATIRIAGTSSGTAEEVIEVALGEALLGAHEPARKIRPWEQFPGRTAQIPPLEVARMSERDIPKPDFVPFTRKDSERAMSVTSLASQLTPVQLQAAPAPPTRSPLAGKPAAAVPRGALAGPKRVAKQLPATQATKTAGEAKQKSVEIAAIKPRSVTASLKPGGAISAAPLVIPPHRAEEEATGSGREPVAADAAADRPRLVKLERPAGGEDGEGAKPPGGHNVPEVYRMRSAADRMRQAGKLGGSRETEEAVEAGLRWLAAAQESDGSWDPRRWGGGRERAVSDHHRRSAGSRAQSGITSLALLAFLGRGHTHMQSGTYQDTVRRALEYLAAHQRHNGDLAGQATLFASMYCHGMATLALSEAYGMTGDARLRPFVERAVGYSLSCQNKQTGGWRYRPGDTGDTSQHGWQVMAIKSAELAGIPISAATKQGIVHFLTYVSSGEQGGLACYRPGQPPSRAMTAEALLCRLFTGAAPKSPLADEAATYLLEEPPASSHGKMNLYYWYYGTMALYHRQDALWNDWNYALQAALLSTQHRSGALAGSWSPATQWGNYGGRVYSTAMATLCLEVYYRFLPLYGGATAQKAEPPAVR